MKAYVFPGQGAQFVGMGKELYDEARIMQEYFEEASNCLDTNFVKLCFASSDIELARMSNAYPSIFLISSSIYALLKEEGIKPDKVAGYNLGEYAAIFAAGGISFPDGLYLLTKYAHFYQELLDSIDDVAALYIKGIESELLHDICLKASEGDKIATIAVYNLPSEHVVTGHSKAVEYVRDFVEEHKNQTMTAVDVAIGLHSSLMDPVVDNFKIYLEKVDFHDLEIPLINCIAAEQVQEGGVAEMSIIHQINMPIFWNDVLDKFSDCDLLIEIGPGTVLHEMAKKKYPEKLIVSINKQEDIETLKEIIAKDSVEAENLQ
jgi:[acyl-carrier-protein] S-malonyltransferase